MDPHAALRKYFTIRQAGTPSSTVQLDHHITTHRIPGEPPMWLVRHCEVGDAICRLPNDEQSAVWSWWDARIIVDECERAIRIAAAKEIDCRRAGNTEMAKRWGNVAADAEAQAGIAERAMAQIARTVSYKAGTERLVTALNERLSMAGWRHGE